MTAILYIISPLLMLYSSLLLLRVWMQWVRADYYNPFVQSVIKITQPVLNPIYKIIPSKGSIDLGSLFLAWLVVSLHHLITIFYMSKMWFFTLSLIPLSIIWLLNSAGTLILWVLIARAVLSWISRGGNPIDAVLYQLTEPFLSPIRRKLPSTGMLDLAPMVILLILYVARELLMVISALIV